MRLDTPLDPTSPEARDWLEEELRTPVYREPEGLLERLWDWLGRLLSGSEGTGGLVAVDLAGSRRGADPVTHRICGVDFSY